MRVTTSPIRHHATYRLTRPVCQPLSTSTSVCRFAYEQGFIVDLTVERADSFTSTGTTEDKVLAGTTWTYRQASLRLLEVRPRDPTSEGPTAPESSPTPGSD